MKKTSWPNMISVNALKSDKFFTYRRFHIKGTFGVYTRSMETIYLSLRTQVPVGTFFMKSPVYKYL